MSFVTVSDGAQIYYKDWGSGPPVLLSHGWPLNSDSWEAQMLFLAANGFRVIAHDRRGHGRSTQTWTGNDMDTYADDLATAHRYPRPAWPCPGGVLDRRRRGRAVRGSARHGHGGKDRSGVGGAAVHAQTDDNPGGVPIEVFDAIRAGVAGRSLADVPGSGRRTVLRREPEGREPVTRNARRLLVAGYAGGPPQCPGVHHRVLCHRLPAGPRQDRCPNARHPRRRRPGGAVRRRRQGIRRPDPGRVLKVYPGAPHGITDTHKEELSADLLAFLSS